MFSWPANRVKPRMKATYTRKKISALNSQTSSQIEAIPRAGSEDSSVVDDATGHDSMDVAPPSHIGSGIQTEDNSMMPDISMAANDSAVVANAANTQLHLETTVMDNEVSEKEGQLYEVEYFLADDYKKVSGSNIPQKALLTKWVGFSRVDELTWEPESDMRDDVPHYVETYYKTKINTASDKQLHEPTKPSRGRPSKVVKATRGRPRKDGNATRGRGRPPKNAQAPTKSPAKNAEAPPKSTPESSQGRRGRGRPRKVQG